MIMINAIFERFVENIPLTVMVRAILQRIFTPEALDEWFSLFCDSRTPGPCLGPKSVQGKA